MEEHTFLFSKEGVELIAMINHEGKILKMISDNQEFPHVYGHLSTEKNLLDLLPLDFSQKVRIAIKRIQKTGQSQKFTHRQPSGEGLHYFEVKLSEINNDNVLTIIRETTERTKTENKFLHLNRSVLSFQIASASITASLELEHVLETFTWELANLLGASGCIVSKWHKDTDTVSIMTAFPHRDLCRIPPEVETYPLSQYPLTKQALTERFSRQIVLNGNNNELPEYDYMAQAKISSLLMLPMIYQDRTFGLVEVIGKHKKTFSNREISLAHLLTSEAASAFGNAQLYDRTLLEITERKQGEAALEQQRSLLSQRIEQNTLELKRQYQRQHALASIKPISNHPDELKDLLEQIIHIAEFALPADGGASIVLWDEEQERFFVDIKSKNTPPKNFEGIKWRGGETSRTIFKNKQMVVVPDIADAPYGVSDWLKASGYRSYVGVPMLRNEECLGIIYVLSRASRNYSQEDLDFLLDLANRAAVTIANVQLYAKLQQTNAELARASKMKDEFLASMSHELRTPLTAVLGITEGLQEQFYGPLNEKQQKSVKVVSESGEHLLALINDILDVAKYESGELVLDIQPTSVESICNTSLQFIRRTAVKKRISVDLKIGDSVSILFADARRIKQILINLLSNAVKFTPEDGAIGLEVYSDLEANSLSFLVWDTGIGIPKEKVGRVFQPFVQLDSSLSRQYEGTGLGLSLVKRMTELHGGYVTVESEVGKGSQFVVTIPLQLEIDKWLNFEDENVFVSEKIELERPRQFVKTETLSIMVVDDDEMSSEILRELFVMSGYRAIIAHSGQAAIQQFESERPDLILMDIQMPEMDGLETIRRIRSMPQGTAVSIIALTALAMMGDREMCLEAGADEYLSKPASFQKIEKTIHALLQKKDNPSGKHTTVTEIKNKDPNGNDEET